MASVTFLRNSSNEEEGIQKPTPFASQMRRSGEIGAQKVHGHMGSKSTWPYGFLALLGNEVSYKFWLGLKVSNF